MQLKYYTLSFKQIFEYFFEVRELLLFNLRECKNDTTGIEFQ